MTPLVRLAAADDGELLTAIESAADLLLIESLGASDWPPSTTGDERIASPGFVLLLSEHEGDAPVGFVHVRDIDGLAHLDQLSVRPEASRRGHGRALLLAALRAARERGYSRLTLRTYAEVPWNAPFYASCGFLESIAETPFQRELVQQESSLGLDRYGRRIQMTIDL